MRQYINRHPLVAFFAIAIGLKWGVTSSGIVPGSIFYGWTPSIAGLVVAWAAGGTTGLRQLWNQALTWRARLRWYLLVFVGFPALVFCIYVLSAFVTDATFTPAFLGVETIVSTFVVILVSVALGEELFGWRGFAMPRMIDRWGDLTANVLLSAGWWLWHQNPSEWLNVSLSLLVIQGLYFFAILGVSIVMTWVYRNTGSALLAGVGIHAAVYFSQLYVTNTPIPFVHFYLLGVIAVIVVAVYGTEHFSWNPLEPSEENAPSPVSSQ